MANIFVNGRNIEDNLDENITIGFLIDSLQLKQGMEDKFVTEISIDGSKVDFQNPDILDRVVAQNGEIHLRLLDGVEIAFESLDNSTHYFDVMCRKIDNIVLSLSQNSYNSANQDFLDLVEVIDLFIQLMTNIHRTFLERFKSVYVKSTGHKNLEIHLLSVLKGLLAAKERNDVIMISDLLEYELKENITQWKIKVIPEMKTLKNLLKN